MNKIILFCFIILTISQVPVSLAQPLVKTIDNTGSGDYSTFTAAITYLNSLTLPDSGIVFNVVAGQVFTEDPPSVTKVAMADKPVIFRKSGDGANPVIKNDNSPADDGVIQFFGASYITFDGIDITNISASQNQYNTAYYVNASNHITIKNCHISNFSVYGIYIRNASSFITIDANEVYYTADFNTLQTSVYGIYANYNSSGGDITIVNNKVYGFKPVTSTLYGIRINQMSGTIANNFVSFTNNGNDKVYGIRIDGREGKTINVLHNSVYLAGNATDDGFALSVLGSAGTVKIRNNLFVNERDTAQFDQMAVHVGYDGLTFNMDYNLYYNHDNFLGRWYNAYPQNIAQWYQVSGVDGHSVFAHPGYTNPALCDLHISASTAGQFFLAGTYLGEFPADIDGDTRDNTFPYKGADENPVSLNLHAALSADSVSFGESIMNVISDSVALVLSNQGNVLFNVDSVTVSDGFLVKRNTQAWNTLLPSFLLNNGSSDSMMVAFCPSRLGFYSGSLKIFLQNGQVLVCNLYGIAIPAGISVIPDTLDFAPTAIVEASAPQVITIKNTGNEALVINSIYFIPGNYEIRQLGQTVWLTQLPQFTIAVNDSNMVEVRFRPSQVQYYSGKMIISSGTDIEIPLYGYGMGTRFELVEGSFIGAWYGKTSLGDYDGDKDLDVLITGYGLSAGQGYAYLYRNNGNLSFSLVQGTGIIGVGNGNADWMDIDGDGDLDLFTSGQMSYQNNESQDTALFYRNDNGIFTRIICPVRSLSSASSDWADIDLDGDYDLAVTGSLSVSENYFTVYENLGNFQFTVFQELPGVSSGMAKFCDYDHDGYPDMALTGSRSSGNYITEVYHFENGHYVKINQSFFGVRYSDLAWGDLDQDGDPDLIVTGSVQNETPSLTRLYSNNGDGSFTEIPGTMAGIRQGDMDLADLDQDGDLDVVMNGIYVTDASWIGYIYLNNGQFDFTLADSIVSLKYAEMVIGDLDNDLDADIFLTGRYDYQNYWSKIYRNDWPVQNVQPSAPESITAIVTGCSVSVIWENPAPGHTANLKIGITPQGDEIFNSLSYENGYRKVALPGNMGMKSQVFLPYLPDNHYSVSVQKIDYSLIASPWSAPALFDIDANNAPEVIGQISDTLIHAGDTLELSLNRLFSENDPFDYLSFALINIATADEIDFYSIIDSVLLITPDSLHVGNYNLDLIAWDRSGDVASILFNLMVKPPVGLNVLTANQLNLYPNPACGKVNIMAPCDGNVIICNALGQTIMNEKLKANELLGIPVINLSPGVYMVIIYDTNNAISEHKKLVIKN